MADLPFCYPATTSFTLNMVHMQTPHLIWKQVKGKEPSSKEALKMDWETPLPVPEEFNVAKYN